MAFNRYCRFTLALLAITPLLLLTACAGAIPGNPQGNAGINEAEIEFAEDGKPKYARIIGGKENESITLNVKTPDGLVVEYSATGAKAFDGHKVRGAVEQAISADAKEAMPGIVTTVTDAIKSVID